MISLILPAYNFGIPIVEKIYKAKTFLQKLGKKYEILVVDDGSDDDTLEKLKRYANDKNVRIIALSFNHGKGAAVREGVLKSQGDYIIFTDADLPYNLEAISKIIEKIDTSAQVVLGSRRLTESKNLAPTNILRKITSFTFSFVANLALRNPIIDTQCGFKGFEKKAAKNIFQNLKTKGFAFDVELISLAQELNYRIEIIPVTHVSNSETTIRLNHMVRMLFDISRLFFSNMFKNRPQKSSI